MTDHCRMLRARFPEPGMVVMATILAIEINQPTRVFLPQYNIEAYMTETTTVVGRTELVIVRQVVAIVGMIPYVRVCMDNIRADDRYDAEEAFAKASYIHSVLTSVAKRYDCHLEHIYDMLGWPLYESLTRNNRRRTLSRSRLLLSLRRAVRRTLKRMVLFTWRIENPRLLLSPVRAYDNGQCYAAAIIRQFEAQLKMDNIIEPDCFLSVQDLLNHIDPNVLENGEYDVRCLEDAMDALQTYGVCAEQYCLKGDAGRPEGVKVYRVAKYKIVYDDEYDHDDWEGELERELRQKGPFAASVRWFNSYRRGDAMFSLDEYDRGYCIADPSWGSYHAIHTMLLTGVGVDDQSRSFFEFMDTSFGDINNGDRGYLRFSRDPCPIFEFVRMTYLPEE